MKLQTFYYLKKIGIDLWISRSPPRSDSAFYFLFLNYHSVGFCCSLDPKVERIPPAILRFLDDLAFAFSIRKQLPHIGELHWPLPRNSDYSLQEAVRLLVNALPEKVLVFGGGVANCVSDVDDVGVKASVGNDAKQILVAEDILCYLGNPQAKEDLWVALNNAGLINGDSSTKS